MATLVNWFVSHQDLSAASQDEGAGWGQSALTPSRHHCAGSSCKLQHKNEMAAPLSAIQWLQFHIVGGGGEALFSFIYSVCSRPAKRTSSPCRELGFFGCQKIKNWLKIKNWTLNLPWYWLDGEGVITMTRRGSFRTLTPPPPFLPELHHLFVTAWTLIINILWWYSDIDDSWHQFKISKRRVNSLYFCFVVGVEV